jgi:hypothetical protein
LPCCVALWKKKNLRLPFVLPLMTDTMYGPCRRRYINYAQLRRRYVYAIHKHADFCNAEGFEDKAKEWEDTQCLYSTVLLAWEKNRLETLKSSLQDKFPDLTY